MSNIDNKTTYETTRMSHFNRKLSYHELLKYSSMSGIVTVTMHKPSVYRARILFSGSMIPVGVIYQGPFKTVIDWVKQNYPNLKIKTKSEFQCELDHILLFGCSSDAPSYQLPPCETFPDNSEELLKNISDFSTWCERESKNLNTEFKALLDSLRKDDTNPPNKT